MEYFSLTQSASRSEFWSRLLFAYFILALGFLANILLQGTPVGEALGHAAIGLASVFTLVALVVVSIQRTRDAAISPWWTVLLAVPTVGFVALGVFGCLPSRDNT